MASVVAVKPAAHALDKVRFIEGAAPGLASKCGRLGWGEVASYSFLADLAVSGRLGSAVTSFVSVSYNVHSYI